MSAQPTFACIIPWSGKNDYLGEALDSVFLQQPAFDEVIVVCDRKELPETANNKRVKWMLTGGAAGAGEARNLGVRNATSDWVVFLDHDDLLLPDYLSTIRGSVSSEVFCLQVQLRYLSGGRTGNFISSDGWHDLPTGACIQRKAFLTAGGFPPMQGGEDMIMFRRLRRTLGETMRIPRHLASYRIHPHSDSSSKALRAYFSTKLCNQIDAGESAISWEEGSKVADEMAQGIGVDPKEFRRAKKETSSRSFLRMSYAYSLSGKPLHSLIFLLRAFFSSPEYFLGKIRNKWS